MEIHPRRQQAPSLLQDFERARHVVIQPGLFRDRGHSRLQYLVHGAVHHRSGNGRSHNLRAPHSIAVVTDLEFDLGVLFGLFGIARAQGAMRCYAGGLGNNGKLVLMKNDFGFQTLAECDFDWSLGTEYPLALRCEGSRIALLVDGQEKLSVNDSSFAYGMFGCGSLSMGRTSFGTFSFQEF